MRSHYQHQRRVPRRVINADCVTVKPDTLTDMTNQMTEKVGLVHGLPYVSDRQGFAATLEQVMLTSSECYGSERRPVAMRHQAL